MNPQTRARMLAAIFGGAFAGSVAGRLGVPFWQTWTPGDQVDCAVLTALFIWFALGALPRS